MADFFMARKVHNAVTGVFALWTLFCSLKLFSVTTYLLLSIVIQCKFLFLSIIYYTINYCSMFNLKEFYSNCLVFRRHIILPHSSNYSPSFPSILFLIIKIIYRHIIFAAVTVLTVIHWKFFHLLFIIRYCQFKKV